MGGGARKNMTGSIYGPCLGNGWRRSQEWAESGGLFSLKGSGFQHSRICLCTIKESSWCFLNTFPADSQEAPSRWVCCSPHQHGMIHLDTMSDNRSVFHSSVNQADLSTWSAKKKKKSVSFVWCQWSHVQSTGISDEHEQEGVCAIFHISPKCFFFRISL